MRRAIGRARALALVLAVAGGINAPAAGQTSAPASQPRTPAAVQTGRVPAGIVKLLDDLSGAEVRRERPVLEAVTTDGPARAGLLRAFDNLGEIRFEPYRLRATTQYSGDLASPRVKAKYPGLDVSVFHVVEDYAIAKYESESYVEDAFFTFTRKAADAKDVYEGWRITSTTDLDGLGVFSARHLWDYGPVRSATSEHFMIIAHPDTIAKVTPALAVAESAYTANKKFWPRPMGERYVIIAPSTTLELSDILQSTVDLSKFVAFAVASVDREGGWKNKGVRIMLQISHFLERDRTSQLNILSHELIHAITRPQTGPFVPIWLEEGLATYAAVGRTQIAGLTDSPDRFPPDHEFSVGTTREIVSRYLLAQRAIEVLAKRSGVEGVAKFYDAIGAVRLAPGTDVYHLDRAVQESVGWTVPEWVDAWRRS